MAIKCILLDDKNRDFDIADLFFASSGGVVLMPANSNTPYKYKLGERIKFQLENKYDRVFDGEIIGISDGKMGIKDIRNIGSILHGDVRVVVDFGSTITCENNDEEMDFDVKVINVSSGGMCFLSPEELPMDCIYEMVVEWVETPIVVKLKLLRKEKTETSMLSYGCTFVGLHNYEESLLRAAVYHIQAKKVKTRRGKENDVI